LNFLKIFEGKKKEKLLWESKDSELTVQVWEIGDRRELRFGNKVLQSVFSVAQPQNLVLPYTRYMLLGLIFFPEPKSILHIGLGGGSIARWFHSEFPNIKQTIIEVNESVIEAAYRFFKFPRNNRIQVINGDATKLVQVISEKFDLIFLDAFNDFGAPEEVKGTDFLRSLCSCLNTSGLVVGNFWTLTGDFKEQCEKWRATFTSVHNARANKKGNEILFGSQKPIIKEESKFLQISNILEERHRIDFPKMNCDLIRLY